MTALDKYIRLEATGQWIEADGHSREVVVSFGNATLVLSDFQDQPLSHWSLSALNIAEQKADKVIYAPDPDSRERLIIDDAQMVEAIAAVSSDAQNFESTPQVSRNWLRPVTALLVLLIAGLVVWYGPDALRHKAISLIPQERAVLLGGDVFDAMDQQRCLPRGRQGLRELTRVLGFKGRDAVRVVKGDARLSALPGAQVMVSDGFLRKAGSGEELAGWLALARETGRNTSAMQTFIAQQSVGQVLNFLMNGEFSQGDIDWMAAYAQKTDMRPSRANLTAALDLLSKSGVPDGPFLTAVAKAYPDLRPVPAPSSVTNVAPLIDDQSWVGLQEICGP